jgi:hypothetical protein
MNRIFITINKFKISWVSYIICMDYLIKTGIAEFVAIVIFMSICPNIATDSLSWIASIIIATLFGIAASYLADYIFPTK